MEDQQEKAGSLEQRVQPIMSTALPALLVDPMGETQVLLGVYGEGPTNRAPVLRKSDVREVAEHKKMVGKRGKTNSRYTGSTNFKFTRTTGLERSGSGNKR